MTAVRDFKTKLRAYMRANVRMTEYLKTAEGEWNIGYDNDLGMALKGGLEASFSIASFLVYHELNNENYK